MLNSRVLLWFLWPLSLFSSFSCSPSLVLSRFHFLCFVDLIFAFDTHSSMSLFRRRRHIIHNALPQYCMYFKWAIILFLKIRNNTIIDGPHHVIASFSQCCPLNMKNEDMTCHSVAKLTQPFWLGIKWYTDLFYRRSKPFEPLLLLK